MTDKSGYTIMFGPDTCGADKKLHFIMRHKHPKTGEYEEKHAKKPTGNVDFYGDKKTHLFRLTVNPDNSWEVCSVYIQWWKLANSNSCRSDYLGLSLISVSFNFVHL